MNEIRFKISNSQYLEVDISEETAECWGGCQEAVICYVDEKKNISIPFGHDFLLDIAENLSNDGFIEKLINNQNGLDPEITRGLGFEHNECYYQGIAYKFFTQYWFQGNLHQPNRPYYDSWLYNDKKGNIVFEITPFYPWHNVNRKTHPDRIPYKQWIKDYKTLVKVIIPRENIIEWNDIAQKIIKSLNIRN